MAAALALAREGIGVTVVERNPDLAEDLRGSTWHPPTLDMMAGLGLVEGIIANGLIARHTAYRDRREGLIAAFDMELLRGETAHPYRVQCEQFKFTQLVLDKLAAYPNCRVLFEHQLVGVEQDADTVRVTLDTPGGRTEISGDYLLGADGSWSAVRQAIGVEFEGFTFPERFYVASTDFDFKPHFENLHLVNYISDPDEWCVLLRVPGLWRVLFPTRPEEGDEAVISDAATELRLQGVVARSEPYRTVHRTVYKVHQRVATRYRVGRAFLAGDAAHINNPLGGMGMNGGLHDALNLCDKLVQIHHGRADIAQLDRYERQRRPIAIEYINAKTNRNKKMMEERDPAVRRRAQEEMRRAAEDPAAARETLRKTAMIDALRRAAAVE